MIKENACLFQAHKERIAAHELGTCNVGGELCALSDPDHYRLARR
jgi:hypothetical protein